jgi:hypothetical protein
MNFSRYFTTFAITALSAIALMTSVASADGYQQDTYHCDKPEFKQVYAFSGYTEESHLHLDVACPYDYRAISCEFDVQGKDDYEQNQYFVAINDATPFEFEYGHNSDYHFESQSGCHFRANNFLTYFPGYHRFYWGLQGTATCVPKECVQVDETYDYKAESRQVELPWSWDQDY